MTQDPSWNLSFKRLPHLDDLKLVHVSDVTHDYPRHVHEEYCIAMILRGTETHISRDGTFTAGVGDLLILNAEEAHANRSKEVEYKSIQINPRSFARLWPGEPKPFFAEPIVQDEQLFRSLLDLYSKLERNLSPLEHESEFVSTIGTLLDKLGQSRSHRETKSVEPKSVAKVRSHLRAHYSENISLSSLASIANLSPFHLVRVFNDQVGVPPHEYQTQVRITNAQRLMRAGRSISDAAMETGFFDQSHFSRNFKRITGLTPGKYLRHSNIVQDRAK